MAECLFLMLPEELIIKILSFKNIDNASIVAIACTCKKLNYITYSSNTLWKKKFQDWFSYDWENLDNENTLHDWTKCIKEVFTVRNRTSELVNSLSHYLFCSTYLTSVAKDMINTIINYSPHAGIFMTGKLMEMLNDTENNCLTRKYYANQVLMYVHKELSKRKWHELLSKNYISLEHGANLLGSWYNHCDTEIFKMVSSSLNEAAEHVRERMQITHPAHPILSCPLNIPVQPVLQSYWSKKESIQILDAINYVLYEKMHISGNTEDYYNFSNSFIHSVLTTKKGIPITMSIIYSAICQRLYMYTEPISLPSRFLIRWSVELKSYEYIDAFDKGKRLSYADLKKFSTRCDNPERFLVHSEPLEVLQQMNKKILIVAPRETNEERSDYVDVYSSAAELMTILNPEDLDSKEFLLKVYYDFKIHFDYIVKGSEELMSERASPAVVKLLDSAKYQLAAETTEIVPKPRKGFNIEFAVGLIMRHKQYNYTCVIYGWDEVCKMSAKWIRQMGVHKLKYQTEQPFYNILVADGAQRYVAQEDLDYEPNPAPFHHKLLGKYFDHFDHMCYVPNNELEIQYPCDAVVRNNIVTLRGMSFVNEC